MKPERAEEILKLGSQWSNYSKHCTPEEDKEVIELWKTMPSYTCWYDALVRIARGEIPERINCNECIYEDSWPGCPKTCDSRHKIQNKKGE